MRDCEVFSKYASMSLRNKFNSLDRLKQSGLSAPKSRLKMKNGVTYINNMESQVISGPAYSSRHNKMSKR